MSHVDDGLDALMHQFTYALSEYEAAIRAEQRVRTEYVVSCRLTGVQGDKSLARRELRPHRIKSGIWRNKLLRMYRKTLGRARGNSQ